MKVIMNPKEYVFFYTYKTKDGGKQSDDFTYPLWYAGFGSPWRLSDNIQDAIAMQTGDITETVILKALQRHTKTDWFTIPVKETYISKDTVCKSCGYAWSDAEKRYVILNASQYAYDAPDKTKLKLGSIFRNPFTGFTDYHASADRILKSNYCDNCGKVCGNCRAKTRGPTTGKCVACLRPRDRRFD